MKIERTKNAARNIVWGIVERLTAVLLPFATRTVLIKVLGAEYLGLDSLFTSVLQVLSISELGISSAIVFSMYRPIAEDNNELLCAFLNLYKKIYIVIGLIILVVGLSIVPLLPKFIAGENHTDVNIYILYLIYLSNTVLSYFLFAYKQALFSAHQRNDLISKRKTIVSIFSNVLQITFLLTFKNYYTFVVVVPLATVLTNILNALLANRMYPKIQCRGTVPDYEIKGIKKRVVGLLSYKIYGVVYSSVGAVIISAFLGLVPLAIYNNYFYVQSAIVSFLVVFNASVTAGIGNKMITNSKEDNYDDFMNLTFANGWITSWCTVCLVTLYQHFMRTWVGDDLTFPFFTMTLIVLHFYLSRVTNMTFTYREAAGLWWEDRYRPLVLTAVNLLLSLVLVQMIGMNGVLLSTIFCTVCISVPWGTFILFKNYFKKSSSEYYMRIILYVVITSVISIITIMLCDVLPSRGWLFLIVKGCICLIIPNVLFWIVFRNFKEYSFVIELLHRLSKRFVAN